jgi:acetyltransferase-like isoleucine patch superfamily enzyme
MTATDRPVSRARLLPRDLGYVYGPRLRSAIRKAWVRARHPHARIEFGRGVYLGPGFRLHMPSDGSLIVGDSVEFRSGCCVEIAPGATLKIGLGTRFTYNVVIQCGTTIEIGERCVFAHAVTIADGSHRFRDPTVPMLEQGFDFRPLSIGDDAAAMAKATVIASLGERAFVGAGAVVTRNIPAYSLAVGVPARPIHYFGPEPADSQAERNSGASA